MVIEAALMTCRHLGIPAFTLSLNTKTADPFLNALGAFEGELPDEAVAEMLLSTLTKPPLEIVKQI